jgi:F420-dependent oxidoreductase-like protein
MRLSICVDTGRPWAEVRRIGELGDRHGWYSVYVCDHFLPYAAPGVHAERPILESWTVLSALAALTAQVRLGPLVLGNTYRHPAVVANMAASLDQVAGGRVVLGLGAGWQLNEHVAYGIDLPPVPERMDRFEEACHVITSLLRHRRSSFDGRYYQLHDAACDPRPVSPRLPVLVGGGGPRRTARIAATYADIWHTWASPSDFHRKCDILDRHCLTVGRDPSEIQRVTGRVVRVSASVAPASPDDDVIGTPEQILEALGRYANSRVSEFIVRDDRHEPIEKALDTMSVLTADVLPHLT